MSQNLLYSEPDGFTQKLDTLQHELGVEFGDLSLLQAAFVHRSFVNELSDDELLEDNERLEFLGDAVLGFVVSDVLYAHFPEYSEGALTRLRSLLVRRETLADLARGLNLADYLLLGRGEHESGGRVRPAILCATFEAVVGAIYLDQGIDGVRRAILPLFAERLAEQSGDDGYKDAKSRLQEWAQNRYNVAPRYRVMSQTGPDHAKTFVIQVSVLQQRIGVGVGQSKQEASQQAALMALVHVGEEPARDDAIDPELESSWPVADNILTLLDEQSAHAQR